LSNTSIVAGGARPHLEWTGTLPPRAIIMEHHGGLFDKDETKHSVVVTLNCHQ